MLSVGIVALGVVAAALIHFAEGFIARWRIRRYLEQRGFTLLAANWRPPRMRQNRYAIVVEYDGREWAGTAFVGGPWTGSVWSRRIEFEWTSESGVPRSASSPSP